MIIAVSLLALGTRLGKREREGKQFLMTENTNSGNYDSQLVKSNSIMNSRGSHSHPQTPSRPHGNAIIEFIVVYLSVCKQPFHFVLGSAIWLFYTIREIEFHSFYTVLSFHTFNMSFFISVCFFIQS